MSVSVDIPRKRIYIRGDLFKGYYWLIRYFLPEYMQYEDRPFWMPKAGELEALNGWTLEHKL